MIKIGTYGINTEEFLDGHLYVKPNKDTDRYGFEDFISDFEGDVCGETVAEAWNKLCKKHGWKDKLKLK